MCSDVEQLDEAEIDAIAAFLHGEQVRQIEEAARRVAPPDAPVVAAGSGAFLAREVAARLGRAVAAGRGGTGGGARGTAGGKPVLTVVKVGGGLGDDALPGLCAALGELGRRHRLLVVPGGAGFADAVREADRRFGLHADTAHRMAILGMEQFGWLLSDLIPGAERCTDLTRAGTGRTSVLLPAGLPLDALPASWQVTSDSIAAWVADRVGAGRLVLVKAVDDLHGRARLTVAELAALRSEVVDEYLPTALEGARFETWVIGGRDPARLAELLERGTTAGTRIAAGRLLRCGDG